MDLKQLEYFVCVAELGSFTRASSTLGIAQPALSRQVRALETELRQHLLVRTGRGVVTTDAGKQLVELGRGLLHQAQRLKDELGQSRGALVGRVVIGLPPSLSRDLAVPLNRTFEARMPEARLSIGTALTRTLEDSLALGSVDLAILFGPGIAPELDTELLVEDPLCLVYPGHRPIKSLGGQLTAGYDRAQPLPLEALAQLPLIIPRRPNTIRMRVEEELSAIGRRPRIALEVDSISAILDLTDDGAGCAVLSSRALVLARAGAQLSSCPIGTPPLTTPLLLATSSRRPQTETIKAAMVIVRELAGAFAHEVFRE